MGISNAQYMDIMYQYDQIRLKNHRILEERRAMVYEKIPGIQLSRNRLYSFLRLCTLRTLQS